jgi:hypothetical protein
MMLIVMSSRLCVQCGSESRWRRRTDEPMCTALVLTCAVDEDVDDDG